MRLDELRWQRGNGLMDFATPKPGLRVWRILQFCKSSTGADYQPGTYAITENYDRGDTPAWRNLSAIEAQAVLYSLLKPQENEDVQS